jgi:hypothetical protein
MNKRALFLFLAIFSLFVSLVAQNKEKDIPFRMSVRAYATVPHSLSNKAFRRSFTGIYDVAASVNYQVFHGINVGLLYHINEWKTADNKIPGLNTYAQANHGGICLGYDFIMSETSTAYISIGAEEGIIKYFGLVIASGTDVSNLKKKYDFHTLDFETGAFFYTEGNFAIGIHSAFIFTNYQFDPYSIHLDQHKAYIATDLNGTWSHFDIGFNVVYSFWKKGAPAN